MRFNKIVTPYDPTVAKISFGGLLAVIVGCLLVPPLAVVVTALTAGVYAGFGVRRDSAVLAVPALIAAVPLALYAIGRDTFVWDGRHYRWQSKFDVEVLSRQPPSDRGSTTAGASLRRWSTEQSLPPS